MVALARNAPTHEDRRCFPVCQRFLKLLRLEVNLGFFLPEYSGSLSIVPVRPKFAVPFLTNQMKHPTCNKYHIRALCPLLDFLAGIFEARKARLALRTARGSGSQARKIASP